MNYTTYTQQDQNIYLIDMTRERQRPFSELMEKGITKFLGQGKKILIINNKKGRSTGVMCHECGHIPPCKQCDIPIAWHKDQEGKMFGICHICKTHYPSEAACSHCGGSDITLYGLGNQQLSDLIAQQRDITPMIIQANLANSKNKIQKIQQQITRGAQLILGTSLLNTSFVNRSPDMVCIINADAGLHAPHYTAKYSTFLFLSQTIHTYPHAEVLLQSYNTELPCITHACAGTTDAFMATERQMRQSLGYPPALDMCVLLYKHEVEKSVYTTVHKLYQELLYLREQYEMEDLEIYATPPSVYKMYGKYRYHIILKGSNVRNYMEIAYSKLKIPQRGFKVDWEPTSI